MIFEFENYIVTIADDMMVNRVVFNPEMFVRELAITIGEDIDNMRDFDQEYSYNVGNIEINVTENSIELRDLTADEYNHIIIDDEEDLTELPNLLNMVVAQLEFDSPFDMELDNEPETSEDA